MSWTTKDVPLQTGKLAVITGASGGLGFETALALVAKGVTVIVAATVLQGSATAARPV